MDTDLKLDKVEKLICCKFEHYIYSVGQFTATSAKSKTPATGI